VPIVNKIKAGELTSGVRRTAEEKKALLKKKEYKLRSKLAFLLI
jgi:hypothetical protein